MIKPIKVLFLVSFISTNLFAQIKVGDNSSTFNPSSILELESTNKGLLLPRLNLVSTTSFQPLLSHVAGMMVYNLATVNDVTPGYYINDGTKWHSITKTIDLVNQQQTAIDNLENQIPIKRAVIIAGQSNTTWGQGDAIIPDFTGKNLYQLGRGTENLQLMPLTFYGTYSHNRKMDGGSFGSLFLYHYYNQLKLDYPNREVQLILIHCGAGSSGWSLNQYSYNSWRTDGDRFTDIISRIKWAKANGYQIDAFLWHQGETDMRDATNNYKDLLKNFIQSMRDYIGNQQLPFILGQLSQTLVNTDSSYQAYQNMINAIPNEVPFTATTSTVGLVLNTAELNHFSAQSHVELGLRYYNNLVVAINNSNPSSYSIPAVGEHLIYNFNASSGQVFPTLFNSIRFGANATDNRYSILGDIWKFKNQDGYYRFKLMVVNGAGINGGIFEWKQKINPFGLSENNYEDRSSCIVLNNTIGLDTSVSGQGFSSLVYDSRVTSGGTFTTLFHANKTTTADDWFFSIGQVANYSNKIPLILSNDTVTHIRLYCVKE
jgi:hypothetical protein